MAENNSIVVCRYLCEELPPRDLEDVELRMKLDEELQQELDFYQGLKWAVADEDMMDYRRQIGRLFESRKRRKHWFEKDRSGIMIAAGLALLVAVMSVIWMTSGGPAHRALFQDHYEHYPGMGTIRSGEAKKDKLGHRAFSHYEQGNWRASEAAFQKMLESGRGGATVHFYLGLVKIELDKDEQALNHFDRTITARHTLFKDQAYWYSALTLLKTGRREEAEQRLTRIVLQDMWKSEKAREILKRFV